MFSNTEQFSTATKETFDTQLAAMNELANKALHSVAELVELNMNTVKASLEHSAAAAQQMLAAKDPQEALTMVSSQAQPNAEKVLAYGRHLAGIASKAQAEFTKAAEARMADTSRQVHKLIEDLSKSAPAGSESAIAMLKTAIVNANAGYEQMSKAAKQASETLEDNMNQAAKHFAPSAEKPARAKK